MIHVPLACVIHPTLRTHIPPNYPPATPASQHFNEKRELATLDCQVINYEGHAEKDPAKFRR